MEKYNQSSWDLYLCKTMRKYIIIICILLFTDYSFSQSVKYIEEFPDSPNIQNADIYALVDGKKIPLLTNENDAKRIVKRADFDFNGHTDILVSTGFDGATCCAGSYVIIFFDGERFYKSKKVGWAWSRAEIYRNEKGYYRFIIRDEDQDAICNLMIKTFGVKGYDFILLQTIRGSLVKAVKEKRESEFREEGVDEHKKQTLYYDIDGDGKEDKLIIEYRELVRRRVILGIIEFANGKTCEIPAMTSRIGILKSVTNGMHDLVIGCDEILKWDGEAYKSMPKTKLQEKLWY